MSKLIFTFFSLLILLATMPIGHTKENNDFITLKKEIVCGAKEKIFQILTGTEAKEKPIWIGHEPDSKTTFILFENTRKKNFTLVQVADSLACVIGMGTMSELLNQTKIKHSMSSQ